MQIRKVLTGLSCACIVIAGCSKNNSSNSLHGNRVIRLGAGLQSEVQVNGKAAVDNGSVFTAAIAGWESSSTVDYGTAKMWLTTASITASETAGGITLSSTQYYSQNSAIKTYIKAWHPEGTLSDDGTVSFGGTPDGTVDVLTATPIVGSAIDMEGKNLAFTHPLTQISFKVKADATFDVVTLSSITIQDVELPTGLDLKTDVVAYDSPSLLAVPNIAASQPIPTTVTAVGNAVMMKPFATNTFKVNIVTSGATYNDVVVTIDTDNAFVAGKAYTITLTFAGLGVGVTASVTPWNNTGTGSGTIQ